MSTENNQSPQDPWKVPRPETLFSEGWKAWYPLVNRVLAQIKKVVQDPEQNATGIIAGFTIATEKTGWNGEGVPNIRISKAGRSKILTLSKVEGGLGMEIWQARNSFHRRIMYPRSDDTIIRGKIFEALNFATTAINMDLAIQQGIDRRQAFENSTLGNIKARFNETVSIENYYEGCKSAGVRIRDLAQEDVVKLLEFVEELKKNAGWKKIQQDIQKPVETPEQIQNREFMGANLGSEVRNRGV